MRSKLFALIMMGSMQLFAQEPKLYNINLLSEINDTSECDAYPWISGDGLRLYYTKGGSTRDRLVKVHRANLNSPFGNPVDIDVNFHEYDVMSCFLSNDELKMYFTVRNGQISHPNANTALYVAERNSVEDEFAKPLIITLTGAVEGFISNPSLTPDKSTLMMYNDDGDKHILIFTQTDEYSYDLTGELPIEDGYELAPGQLSKDGLKFFIGLEKDEDSRLCYYSRRCLTDPFVFQDFFGSDLKDSVDCRRGQPSVIENESVVIFTKSITNTWQVNDLCSANLSFGSKSSIEHSQTNASVAVDSVHKVVTLDNITSNTTPQIRNEKIEFTIYPNPAEFDINVACSNNNIERVQIYDMQGKILFDEMLTSTAFPINFSVSDFSPGLYFCTLISENKFSETRKFLVVER